MTRDDRKTVDRRRVLTAIGVGTAGLAGCLGDDGDGASDDGGGGSDTTDGGAGTTTAGRTEDPTAGDSATTTGRTDDATPGDSATTTPETTTIGDAATSTGGTPTPIGCDEVPEGQGAATVGIDDRDWAAIAGQERKYPYNLPDEAPAYFGFQRLCPGRLTILFGGTEDSADVEAGTVYVLLLVDGSVEGVVRWETPLNGDGDRLVLDAEAGLTSVDLDSVSRIVVAWEHEGEIEVVYDSDD